MQKTPVDWSIERAGVWLLSRCGVGLWTKGGKPFSGVRFSQATNRRCLQRLHTVRSRSRHLVHLEAWPARYNTCPGILLMFWRAVILRRAIGNAPTWKVDFNLRVESREQRAGEHSPDVMVGVAAGVLVLIVEMGWSVTV